MLFCEEAARLTLPNLKNRIIQTNLRRGPSLVTGRLSCVHDPSDNLKLLYEQQGDVGHSLIDSCPPCTTGSFPVNPVCETNNVSRQSNEFFLGWKMMQRFADVCDAHMYDKRFFDRQQKEINSHYQYILFEWNDYLINGLGHDKLAFNGVEYYLEYISANYRPEVRVYGTSDGTSTGTAQPFGLPMVRKLLTTVRCDQFDAIITDLDTNNSLMTLIEAAGGNTSQILMSENFGVPVMSDGQYNGVPIIVNDFVGRAKSSTLITSATTLVANDTLSQNAAYAGWIGFSQIDVGRSVSATGATFGGATSTTIASVIDAWTVVLTTPADAAITSGTTVDFAQTNAMYAIKFDEDNGLSFRHPTANGSSPANVYKCLPSVCGLHEIILGHLQTCPTTHRTAIQLRGNFNNESVESLASLSGYDLL